MEKLERYTLDEGHEGWWFCCYVVLVVPTGTSVLHFAAAADVGVECPIMKMDFEVGDEVVRLPCGHKFSPDGIEHWLKEVGLRC